MDVLSVAKDGPDYIGMSEIHQGRRVMVHKMTYKKRRDARDLFPQGICDDL